MNKFSVISATVITALTASNAMAAFSMNIFAGSFPLEDGSLVNIVVDTEDDGFGDFTDATTFNSSDSDDQVVGVAEVISNLFVGTQNVSGTFSAFSTDLADRPLALVGYNLPASDVGVENGDVPPEFSVPGPGEGVDFVVVTGQRTPTNENASAAPTSFGTTPEGEYLSVTGTTVPEPGTATAMIAALGGLVMMSRRRRSA